jgi:phosphate/sulfate permease
MELPVSTTHSIIGGVIGFARELQKYPRLSSQNFVERAVCSCPAHCLGCQGCICCMALLRRTTIQTLLLQLRAGFLRSRTLDLTLQTLHVHFPLVLAACSGVWWWQRRGLVSRPCQKQQLVTTYIFTRHCR